MMIKFSQLIKAIKNGIPFLFTTPASVVPLQLTRVTEKFDIVVRPPFRDAIGGGRINH
jgi:hypothetical protein